MAKKGMQQRYGNHRAAYERAKKIIFATQDVCGICGQPVDFNYKWPHPLSPTVDHIVPLDKGGHPSDLANLQLAHLACNRAKSDKLCTKNERKNDKGNLVLEWSQDWTKRDA